METKGQIRALRQIQANIMKFGCERLFTGYLEISERNLPKSDIMTVRLLRAGYLAISGVEHCGGNSWHHLCLTEKGKNAITQKNP